MSPAPVRTASWRLALAISRVGLAGLLLWAAIPKLREPAAFAQDIAHYQLLPASWIAPLALALPALEAVVALALLTRPYFRGAALLAGMMLGVFATAMAQAKLRGIDLSCGCFGSEVADPVSWTKVAFDAGLAMLAGWVARTGHVDLPRLKQLELDRPPPT